MPEGELPEDGDLRLAGSARAKWPRRRVLTAGFGCVAGLAVAGVTGVELVSRGVRPGKAILALRVGSRPLAPMAMVTVDGGGGYWNPHPGDDPMTMVIGELIARCQRLGLGPATPAPSSPSSKPPSLTFLARHLAS